MAWSPGPDETNGTVCYEVFVCRAGTLDGVECLVIGYFAVQVQILLLVSDPFFKTVVNWLQKTPFFISCYMTVS
jgi:hypothetical protein